jgi:D-beta-D-heptose 7-phosphate kinase/D-beta-D-heptose 1-phosphate adenosyltransferase
MRAEGRRLVLTNGCFDLLHVGHIRYLQAARALGDALAVGLNGDASVRRLKGEGRPVTPQDERAEVLAALRAVDFVTIFGEDTASQLVRAVQPAVYVKGGDYSADPHSPRFPIEGEVVASYGGAVVIVDYVPGYSSSEILQHLTCPPEV